MPGRLSGQLSVPLSYNGRRHVKAMVPIRNGGYTLVDTTGGNVGSLLPARLNGNGPLAFENISAIQPTFTLSGVNVQNRLKPHSDRVERRGGISFLRGWGKQLGCALHLWSWLP